MNATIFQKHRIPIVFARDGHDVLTEEGQMIGTLHALAASLERELILQRVAQRRDRPLHARRVDDYLVSGLLFCEHCGRRLVGHRENRRGTRHYSCHESRTGGQHRQRENREYVGMRSCPGFTRPADEVEEAIIQAVRDLAHSPAVRQMAQDRLQAAMDEKDTRLHDELAGVTEEVGRVQQGFTRLFALLDEGKIKPEEFEAENNRRRGEEEAFERRRLQLEAELAQRRGRLAQLTAALELLRDFDRLWAKMTAGERRGLLRRIDPHMTMRRDSDALVLTIRPGWTQPLEIGFALNPRQAQWTPGQDAPLPPAQLSLLCSWQEGMSLHEIARARDISHTQLIATAREACRRLDVPDLDAAVELVPERLERCRATIRTKGRFNKRPFTDPNLLSEPLLAILRLMAEGKRCVQIAADLGKNKSTISRQMLQINRRLAVRSQNEAVERARGLGLI